MHNASNTPIKCRRDDVFIKSKRLPQGHEIAYNVAQCKAIARRIMIMEPDSRTLIILSSIEHVGPRTIVNKKALCFFIIPSELGEVDVASFDNFIYGNDLLSVDAVDVSDVVKDILKII